MKGSSAAGAEDPSEEKENTKGAFYPEDIPGEEEKKGLYLVPAALAGRDRGI